MNNSTVLIQRIDDNLPLPKYATTGSSGVDLYASIKQEIILPPEERTLIPAGIALNLPEGYEAQIRSRSGLSYKYGIIVLNSPGTIDADYRGEIKVLVRNCGKESFVITRGIKIAQLVLQKVEKIKWKEISQLNTTKRNEGGFGSTGI